MRLEQWGAGKEHYRMASKYPNMCLELSYVKEILHAFI